jgi:hypothetical protein
MRVVLAAWERSLDLHPETLANSLCLRSSNVSFLLLLKKRGMPKYFAFAGMTERLRMLFIREIVEDLQFLLRNKEDLETFNFCPDQSEYVDKHFKIELASLSVALEKIIISSAKRSEK